MHKKISDYKHGKHHTGNAICGHKCNVYTAQISRLYNGMLVYKHAAKHQHTQPIQPGETTELTCKHHAGGTTQVLKLRNEQLFCFAHPGGYRIQVVLLVKFFVLQGINNIKAAYPEKHGK